MKVAYTVYKEEPEYLKDIWLAVNKQVGGDAGILFCQPKPNKMEVQYQGLWIRFSNNTWVVRVSPSYFSHPAGTRYVEYIREDFRGGETEWFEHMEAHFNRLEAEETEHEVRFRAFCSMIRKQKTAKDKWDTLLGTEWFPLETEFRVFIATMPDDVGICKQLLKASDSLFFGNVRKPIMHEWMRTSEGDKCVIGAVKIDPTQTSDGIYDGQIVGACLLLKNHVVSIGIIPDYRRRKLGTLLMKRAYGMCNGNLYAFLPDVYFDEADYTTLSFFANVCPGEDTRSVTATFDTPHKSIEGVLYHYSNYKA